MNNFLRKISGEGRYFSGVHWKLRKDFRETKSDPFWRILYRYRFEFDTSWSWSITVRIKEPSAHRWTTQFEDEKYSKAENTIAVILAYFCPHFLGSPSFLRSSSLWRLSAIWRTSSDLRSSFFIYGEVLVFGSSLFLGLSPFLGSS